MAWTIRSVIQEALYRANVVGRRQTIPDDKFEDGLDLLRDIAADFSGKNLLQWLRRTVESPLVPKTEMTLGKIDPTIPSDSVDILATDPDVITEVYFEQTNPEENPDLNTKLGFVAFEDFWQSGWGAYVYTWQATSDTKLTLYLKKAMVDMIANKHYGLKIVYNQAWKFGPDDNVRAPDAYRSLFLAALTYRMAVRWPRLTEERTQRLKTEMDDRIAAMSSKTRANKFVTRDPRYARQLVNQAQLMSGSYIFPQ